MSLKTIRRDKLKRLAKEGKLVCVSSYHFDDMYGESRGEKTLPVKLVESVKEAIEGVICLTPWHFSTKSGCAYQHNGCDVITLHVHSNLYFDFKVVN